MPYYLVIFTLGQNYFDAQPEVRESLTKQEIDYGVKLFKVGIWRHAYTTMGEVKTNSWAIYKTSDEATLERYLAGYPMDKLDMYTKTIREVTVVDPPWYVGLLYKALRLVGLFKPWKPAPLNSPSGASGVGLTSPPI